MNTKPFIPFFISSLTAAFALTSISAQLASADSFVQAQMNAELKAPTPLTQSQLEKVQTTQFIFVDGIFGDVFKSNFTPAVEVLTDDWNVTDKAVITPDTRNAMSLNADLNYAEILKIRAASPHSEAVLTAHSKGATETLIMFLRHPDLITQLGIKTINLVSGPHEGTNVVQYFNHCSDLDLICGLLNNEMPSVEGFVPENIIPIEMAALNALDSATQQEVAKHIFYVETKMKNDEFSSPLLPTHFYLNSIGDTENDGLIPTANEVFTPNGQSFGTDLGVMNGDHNSLLSKAITSGNKTYRHTFFQVLIKNSLLQ